MGEILEREKIELPIEGNAQIHQESLPDLSGPNERASVSDMITQLPAEDWQQLLETMEDSTDIL